MTDTAFYLVKEPLTEGYRIRLSVSQGLVNVKGSVGRVPSKNQFQLVGVPNDDFGKEVTLTIATTIPCTECGMSDFNLYLLVEVRNSATSCSESRNPCSLLPALTNNTTEQWKRSCGIYNLA